MPAQLIERTLAEWREGERVLRMLPRMDEDHESVRLAVIRLREAYQRLSDASTPSQEILDECRSIVEGAHETIEAVRSRLAT